MADLTDEEIAELRRLSAAATPPPWRLKDGHARGDATKRPDVARTLAREDEQTQRRLSDITLLPEIFEGDAALAVAARNNLPRALDELEALRRELKVTAALRKSAEDLAEERRLELERYRGVLGPR